MPPTNTFSRLSLREHAFRAHNFALHRLAAGALIQSFAEVSKDEKVERMLLRSSTDDDGDRGREMQDECCVRDSRRVCDEGVRGSNDMGNVRQKKGRKQDRYDAVRR